MEAKDAKDAVDRWESEGRALLGILERDRDAKLVQMATLDSEVSRLEAKIERLRSILPDAPAPGARQSVRPTVTLRRKIAMIDPVVEPGKLLTVEVSPAGSLVDAVRSLLQAADHPLSARAIFEAIGGFRDVEAEDIHKAIYRLGEQGEIQVSGERPKRLYSLKNGEQTSLAAAK